MTHEIEFEQIFSFINNGKKFLITTHETPDGDAVGSSLGLYFALRELGKEPYLFCKDEIPSHLLFLAGANEFQTVSPKDPVDAIIALDYGSLKRLGIGEYRGRFPGIPLLTIDHHLKRDQEGVVILIDPEASSTSELIYYFLKYAQIPISRSGASAILTGIFTDSGGFRHVCTTSETLEAVSELLLKGCSTSYVARKTLRYPEDLIPVFGKILSRIELDAQTGMTSSWLSHQDIVELNINTQKLEGVATILGTADRARFSLFLTEKRPNFIEASLRSEPFKGFEVNRIAEHFGGGGHKYAAGFRKEGTIEDVVREVKEMALQLV